MVDRSPGKPFSFAALRKTFGPLYLRCDICRRFALLQLGPHGLRDVDYRTKRFSCSVCGDEAWLTVTDPAPSVAWATTAWTSVSNQNGIRAPSCVWPATVADRAST